MKAKSQGEECTSSPVKKKGFKNGQQHQHQQQRIDPSILKPLKRIKKIPPLPAREYPLSIRRERYQPQPQTQQKKKQGKGGGGQKKISEYLKGEEKEEKEEKVFRCYCGKGTAENPGGLIIQCNICKIWFDFIYLSRENPSILFLLLTQPQKLTASPPQKRLHKRCTHRGYGSTRKKRRVFVCLNCHFSPPNLWDDIDTEAGGDSSEGSDVGGTPTKKRVRFREHSGLWMWMWMWMNVNVKCKCKCNCGCNCDFPLPHLLPPSNFPL